jgi:hypothetical protein
MVNESTSRIIRTFHTPLPCLSAGAMAGRPLRINVGTLTNICSPICIGPLVPEPAHAVNNDPRPTLEEFSTATSHKPANHEAKASHQETAIQAIEDPTKDDILTINTCGHSFHSKCLSSWFLIERHDCPVCRVQFYKGTRRREPTLNVSPFW